MASAPTAPAVTQLPTGMDPAYYSLSLLRRRRLEVCVSFVAGQLNDSRAAAATAPAGGHGVDELLWYVQTKALVLQSWFDDADLDDDGVDDVLLEGEQAVVSAAHRPSTSLRAAAQGDTAGRAASRVGGGGRPLSSRCGFARPGTVGTRPGSVRGRGSTAMRPGTGRFVRLGTASLQAVPGGPHIDVQRLDLAKYAREKPLVAKLLCDYLLYVEHKPKFALELCMAALRPLPPPPSDRRAGLPPMRDSPSLAVKAPAAPPVGPASADDWWWKARLAKASYQLGLLREAEKHFRAALFEQMGGLEAPRRGDEALPFANYNTTTLMELGKVYRKLDQPLTALELFSNALKANPIDHHILLCCARLHEELTQPLEAFQLYQHVLHTNSNNVEAIACIAAYVFYERGQPEAALRYYRRLLQMGVDTAEVWNNIGLCAFYATQLDFAISCFERAMSRCGEDAQRADVWYNVGHVSIGLGDLPLAEQAFALAAAADSTHAEALNNLAVLLFERERRTHNDSHVGRSSEGRRLLELARRAAPELVEAFYNTALIAYHHGELEHSYAMVTHALGIHPNYTEAVELQAKLREQFIAL